MHKSIRDIVSSKNSGKKITALTSFDYTLARMCDAAGTVILIPFEALIETFTSTD